ncbi:MAG: polyprenol monophosphomannose synthase [Microbacteriaceae bacterium]|nr:polyprenol monophosphomannose synthase [Microbacteriaceae bacterium]
MANTLVVVPTYNEITNLPKIVGRLRQSVPFADILIVDDSSPDGTGEKADELSRQEDGVFVLHRSQKDGLGRAYLEAFSWGLNRPYHYIIEIDADGSHDPMELQAMHLLAEEGADLVIGSRWIPGGSVLNWPWVRRFISRSGNQYAKWALRSKINDLTSGFRVFRSSTLREMDLEKVASQGYCFQIELAWLAESSGLSVVEHPIKFLERTDGKSKMHFGIVAEALIKVTWWGISRRKP